MSGGTGGTDHPAEPRGGETSGGSPQGRRPPLIGFFGSLVSQPKLFWSKPVSRRQDNKNFV
jgi:hypothetical protein